MCAVCKNGGHNGCGSNIKLTSLAVYGTYDTPVHGHGENSFFWGFGDLVKSITPVKSKKIQSDLVI